MCNMDYGIQPSSMGFRTKEDEGQNPINGGGSAPPATANPMNPGGISYAGQRAYQAPNYSMTPGVGFPDFASQLAASFVDPARQFSNGSQFGRWNQFNGGNPFARNGQTPTSNPYNPTPDPGYTPRPYTTPGTWNIGMGNKPYLPAGPTTTNPTPFTQPGNVNSAPGALYSGQQASVDPNSNPISTAPAPISTTPTAPGGAPRPLQKSLGFTPGAGNAQTDANGAFAPGGDIFNVGGQSYSANDILSKFFSLPQDQQNGLYSDNLVSNALGVNMGRNAANQLVQAHSAGGSAWSPNQGQYNFSALFGNLGQR